MRQEGYMCLSIPLNLNPMIPCSNPQFYIWYLRVMGGTVGRDVCCLGGYSSECDQLVVGDGAVMGQQFNFLAHTVEDRKVKIRPITIKARATLGHGTYILPDAAMEELSSLSDMSVVSRLEKHLCEGPGLDGLGW